jgi:DNA polymerase II large subunit
MRIDEYLKHIETKVKVSYSIAEEAREKGFDPKSKVEIPLATNLAEKVAGLIATLYPQVNNPGLIKRFRELEKEHGVLDPAVCLKIAEEVAKEKFCKFKSLLEAIDGGIRIAMAYVTLGVVSSPIEGFTHFQLKKTKENKDYFCLYYSGPIRSAGGTGAAFSLVIADYLREIFGFAKYDPDEKEIKRTITEIIDYHERVTNLQYFPTEKEIEFLAKNIPVQINGEPSSQKEVSNYKDLNRIETNFIRSGFCLTFAEGLAQKAPKILKMIKKLREKGFKLSDWDFLEEFVELRNKKETGKTKEGPTYIKDLVAGRPVLGHPSRKGAFRLRYGRARNTGYSCLAVHPATMFVLEEFVGIGTQLKIELPTKGAAISSCDSIEGPIVKLKNGSVKKIYDTYEAKKLNEEIEEIIYTGDLLVPYGDFANRNHHLMPAGYCEQEWWQEFKQALNKQKENNDEFEIEDIYNVSFDQAIEISKKLEIPLHPGFIYYWSQISKKEFDYFIEWLEYSKISEGKLIFPFSNQEREKFSQGKRVLEILGIGHNVFLENVILNLNDSKFFIFNLGLEFKEGELKGKLEDLKNIESQNVLEIINKFSEVEIRDKAGTFIGSRMGRPEKGKLRKLTGSPNGLFPVGKEGGRFRSVNDALDVGEINSDFPVYKCKSCGLETIYPKCEKCLGECSQIYYCKECKKTFPFEKCPTHEIGQTYYERKIKISEYFNKAVKYLDLLPEEIPSLIKGVKGTSNKNHIPERLEKGILRAMFDLQVNKDGTVRFDSTELPLTHFKPKEISVSIDKLKELGYTRDIFGKTLENEEQILELKPHDIVLPCCPDSPDEGADNVFSKVANFVDTLLIRYYKQKSFYDIKSREDLVGNLTVCMAPHNCAGVISRIIGFSKMQGILAHPYMHAAIRRDCDGDELAVMLLLDVLLNFSKEFLPSHRGGTQDAPLVLNMKMKAGEVDDMVFDLDIERELPLELYQAAREFKSPYDVKISQIRDRLGKDEFTNLWYEYETSDINNGVLCSAYKRIPSMAEKVEKQMRLAEKLRAVDENDVARLIIDRHFMRDIRGNLRKFSQQTFRCGKCNTIYRRPYLAGKCVNCPGKIIFTISEGFIMKYVKPAFKLAEEYKVPPYIQQSLDLTRSYIESIFGKEKEKQESIKNWI